MSGAQELDGDVATEMLYLTFTLAEIIWTTAIQSKDDYMKRSVM